MFVERESSIITKRTLDWNIQAVIEAKVIKGEDRMKEFINFLEQHLGEIAYGWDQDENGDKLPFQVLKFNNGPSPGTCTFTTLGLSDHGFTLNDEKVVYQELVFIAYAQLGNQNIPGILMQVGKSLLYQHQALLSGEVIGPYDDLLDQTNMQALYVTSPVYFTESFHYYKGKKKTIVMAWLIPVTAGEAHFVIREGWNSFEDLLEQKDPDLVDFTRKSLI